MIVWTGVAIALVVGILCLMAWLILSELRKARARREYLIQHGYRPVDSAEAGLLERITAIHQAARRQRQWIKLRNVFCKPIAGGQLYLFDLVDTRGDDSDQSTAGMAAVVSPDLRLPYLTLTPFPGEGSQVAGFLARAAEKMVDWAAAQGGFERFRFEAYPDFDRNFLVFGRDEMAVREFLSEMRLRQLSGLERRYQINAGGDILIMGKAFVARSGKARPEQDLDLFLADAQRLFAWFQ